MEVYNYYGCVAAGDQPAHQGDLGALPRLRARPLRDWLRELFKEHETPRPAGGDPPPCCPSRSRSRASASSCARRSPQEVDLRARGTEIVPLDEDSERSIEYRKHMNAHGSPSEIVAQDYAWRPGTELARKVVNA